MSTVLNLTRSPLPLTLGGPLASGESRDNVTIGALEQTYIDATPPRLAILTSGSGTPLPRAKRLAVIDYDPALTTQLGITPQSDGTFVGSPVLGASGVVAAATRPTSPTSGTLWVELDSNGDPTGRQEVFA